MVSVPYSPFEHTLNPVLTGHHRIFLTLQLQIESVEMIYMASENAMRKR